VDEVRGHPCDRIGSHGIQRVRELRHRLAEAALKIVVIWSGGMCGCNLKRGHE
jgi:hypothetical protein